MSYFATFDLYLLLVTLVPACITMFTGFEALVRFSGGSARRHPQRAVEPDHFAVEHLVLDDVGDEAGELVGVP